MNAQDHVIFGSLLHDIENFFAKAQFEPQLAGLKPLLGNKEKILEQLIQISHFFGRSEQADSKSAKRLESILGKVTLNNHSQKDHYFLPLTALDLTADAIFPQKNTNEVLSTDYQNLANALLSDLKLMSHYDVQNPAPSRAIVRSLLALMEKYLSQVPADSDISLFDLQRTSAAIAEGLYHYHADNLATANFADQQIAKWRLVCGDFSGIQTFIYKITSKGAAKGLRGRSFFIQLLCDAAAEQLIRKLGLYATARIYSSGGKFYLLIAENKLDALKGEVEKINQALLRQFRGEMYLGIGTAKIKAEDFKAGNMGKRWQEVNEDLLKNRQQAFVADVSEDISCFMPEDLHTAGACQVCDRDDAQAAIQQEKDDDGSTFRICYSCKELREIGRVLADSQYLFWVWGKDRDFVSANIKKNPLRTIELCGTDCTVYFLENSPEFKQNGQLYDCHLESLNDINLANSNQQGYSTGFRFVGKWQRAKTSGEFDFEDFAEHAEGIKRMGILRMDVDNLGEIFIRGLNVEQNSMGSLSRVATLSRQLHLFFAGYLTTLSKNYPLSQIIYAGGDDVFIIGSWQELPQLANEIRAEFKRYCADNDSFTLSGGIALAAGKYPISKTAQAAGDAESQAKQLKRGSKEKDALTFLDATIGWESFNKALAMKDKICALTHKTNSHALIDRLRSVVIATNEIKKMPTWTTELLYWHQWRWRLIYNLKRMAERNSDIKQDLKDLQRQLLEEPTNNDQSVIDWLQMPVRWAEFLKRK